ncbi:MAG TPA: flagellar filament capping protein FliD, partial [Gemmatimonadaceae bacterium]|nr:flagellar filament capping protein FliD [Gemmatimonadaceae bacterium]
MTSPVSSTSTTGSSASSAQANVAGLASGIQWNDLITSIIAAETAQKVTPLQNDVTTAQSEETAWTAFSTTMAQLQTAATQLRDTSFNSFQPYTGTDPSGKTLLTATATSSATPGDYSAQVVSLAQAEQLGGATFASASTALGISGSFWINGSQVTVASTDTLAGIQSKINAANTGSSATGVSASVLGIGANAQRLVLTSSVLGASGIQLIDPSGVLNQLGLVDSSTVINTTSSGGAQSYRLSDSTDAVATVLGATAPAATTLQVGNKTIAVNLATDSLTTIAAAINAAGITASVVSSTYNGQNVFTLQVGAPVSAIPGNADSAQTAALLGFTSAGLSAIPQSLADQSALGDSNTSGVATAATLLTDLNLNGSSAGLSVGDTINIAGTRGDGVAVTTSLTVGAGSTVQDLLNAINASSAFGASARSATASIDSSGVIHLTDGTGGASQLNMSMVVNTAAGGTTTLGQMAVQTAGYARQLVQGSDAQIVLDGTLLTRQTNSITDAIPGVTINLQAAEPGTTIDLPITLNTSGIVTDVQSFVTAYNNLVSLAQTDTTSGGPLAYNSSIRGTVRTLTQSVLETIPGLASGAYQRVDQVGLTVDQNGVLSLNSTTLQNALTSNFADVKTLFSKTTTASAGLTYVSDTAATQSGTFAVDITAPATVAQATGAGFTGAYSTGGSGGDNMSITDGLTLATATITLSDGETMDDIVSALNTAFQSKGMPETASAPSGQLVIASTAYGSSAKFNVSFGGATNPVTQLGIAEQQYVGTDIAGTIDGQAATGSGTTLTGATGSDVEGLQVSYSGSTPYTGQIIHSLGVAGVVTNEALGVTQSGTGLAATENAVLADQITALNTRITA